MTFEERTEAGKEQVNRDSFGSAFQFQGIAKLKFLVCLMNGKETRGLSSVGEGGREAGK